MKYLEVLLFGLYIGFISIININYYIESFELKHGIQEPYMTGLVEEINLEELTNRLDKDGYSYIITTGNYLSKTIDIYIHDYQIKLPLELDSQYKLIGNQEFNGYMYRQLDFDNIENMKFTIKIEGFKNFEQYTEYIKPKTTSFSEVYFEDISKYENIIIILTIILSMLFSYNIVSRNKYEIFVLKLNGFDNFEIVSKIFKKSFKLIILMFAVSICISLPSILRYISYFGFDYEIVKAYGYILSLNIVIISALILYLYFSCFRFNLETMRREYDEVL